LVKAVIEGKIKRTVPFIFVDRALRHNEEPCPIWGRALSPPMGGLIKAAPCGCGYLHPLLDPDDLLSLWGAV